MNIILFLILMITNFFLITISYKIFGKKGLIAYISVSLIAANIQVNKVVEYNFGSFVMVASLGNAMFGGVFLATDLISEKYGQDDARKAVFISVVANLSFVLVMVISSLFEGIDGEFDKEISNAIDLFYGPSGTMVKMLIISNVVYLSSQTLDIFIFDKIKEKNPDTKWLFVRNNISTAISQLVDTILFVTLATLFTEVFTWDAYIDLVLTTYFIKLLVALVDTPFIYLLTKIEPLEME